MGLVKHLCCKTPIIRKPINPLKITLVYTINGPEYLYFIINNKYNYEIYSQYFF